jgi:hypothetical protein
MQICCGIRELHATPIMFCNSAGRTKRKLNGGDITNDFYHPRSLHCTHKAHPPYHFQADLSCCNGTFEHDASLIMVYTSEEQTKTIQPTILCTGGVYYVAVDFLIVETSLVGSSPPWSYFWLTYVYAHVGMLVCTHIMLVCTRGRINHMCINR